MQLVDGFLEQALSFMRSHSDIAGVGGRVLEMNLDNPEYQTRNDRWAQEISGATGRLDCGGLYRRSAIEATGYFSDRNLHSYEEFDLAARLRTLGWGLWRLPVNAVSHYGHTTRPYQLLWRRWHCGYLWGLGELLRASACGTRLRLRLALQEIREIRLYTAVLMWWAVLLALPWLKASATFRIGAAAVVLLAPLALMTWRKRSLERGFYAVTAWCFNTAGMVRGLMQKPRFSQSFVESRLLQDAHPIQPPPSSLSTTTSTHCTVNLYAH
jgi:hypothetical protein